MNQIQLTAVGQTGHAASRGAACPICFKSGDQRFLLTTPAPLLTDFLIASFASPAAFWASPLISCAAPSVFNRSEPTAEPISCLTLPTASFVTPAALSAVLPVI
jgi:hypothetical protein